MSFDITRASKDLLLKNILAYIVVIFGTPVLTRLYDPGKFGTLSLMIFVGSILGVLFTARLELAIPLVRERAAQYNLIKVLLISSLLGCIISSIITFLFMDSILKMFFSEETHGNWLLVVPFYGLALSVNSILILFLTKKKRFPKIGISLLVQNFTFCFLALILSEFNNNFNGLIVAKFSGLFVSILFISIISQNYIKELIFCHLNRKIIKKISGKLKQFAQFNFPISIMGIVGKDLMVLIFAASQGVAYAGFYVMARVVGEFPTSMLSGALGPVFYSQTASSINGSTLNNKVTNEIKLIIKFLLTVLIPTYLIISIWSVEIFKFVFGLTWGVSGSIFLFLLPISIISLFSCWLTRLFEVLGKQKLSFAIQFTFEVTGFVIAMVLIYFKVEIEIILVSTITCYSFVPIFITLFSFKMLGLKSNALKLLMGLFVLFVVINGLINTKFSDIFGQSTQTIWLIFSSVLFLLLGHILFRTNRLRELNVFS
jgi:O-antigen/teichoic acid export membrane protein